MKQQEVEKEQRLEALREKVRVVAEPDPYRVVKDTQVCARQAPLNLYHVYTYSDVYREC